MTIGGIEFDLRLVVSVVLATVVPMLDWYAHRLTPVKAYDRLIYYLLIPMLVIVVVFRDSPADYGFRIGDWRTGLKWVLIGCAVVAPVLWFAAQTPAMQRFYTAKATEGTPFLIYITGVDLLGWEFMWRGFFIMALARPLGPGPAILLQAVPFAFMHLGKPEVETFSTLFGGIAFGFIAWQSGSFIYPFLIHWFVSTFTLLVASGRIG
jgi:uncharacterized protein